MKVLFFGSVFPRFQADPEVPWLRETLLRLRGAGVDAKMLAPSWGGLEDHEIDGIPVFRFRYGPASWEHLTHDEGAPSKVAKSLRMRALAALYILCGTVRCLRVCLKERPDAIHAHWPFPHALMALPAAKLLRIPLVVNFHGAELLLVRKFPWVAPVLRFLIGRADAVVANSGFTAGRVKALREADVEVVPYGSPLPAFEGQAKPFEKSPRRILFVGRHIERKGIPFLIRAMAELRNPEEWELRIVGTGDVTEALKEEAARSPQSARIVFTGKLASEELAREYLGADVFALPAIVDSKGDTEGLGVVLIEAVAAGLPLVASDVGGIPDVVVDGETGLLVPEKDPAALARAFERLASDPALRAKVAEGAKQRCAEFFSWDRVVANLVAVYERVLSGEGSAAAR